LTSQSPVANSEGADDQFFPQAPVTSNLDLEIRKADHRQGRGGGSKKCRNRHNPFVLRILIGKLLPLKILQTILANPAPVKPFRGGRGRGIPPAIQPRPFTIHHSPFTPNPALSRNETCSHGVAKAGGRNFFSENIHSPNRVVKRLGAVKEGNPACLHSLATARPGYRRESFAER